MTTWDTEIRDILALRRARESEKIDICHKPSFGSAVVRAASRPWAEAEPWGKFLETGKSSTRCKAEHVFQIVKRYFGCRKTTYHDITKNMSRFFVPFCCACFSGAWTDFFDDWFIQRALTQKHDRKMLPCFTAPRKGELQFDELPFLNNISSIRAPNKLVLLGATMKKYLYSVTNL